MIRTHGDVPSTPDRPRELSRDRASPSTPGRVLGAEDDDELRSLMAWVLRKEGYVVSEAENGVEFLLKVGHGYGYFEGRHDSRYDITVTEARMPGLGGTDVLRTLSPGSFAVTPVILVSAFADEELRAEARRLGVVPVLGKPFLLDDLVEAVGSALAARPSSEP